MLAPAAKSSPAGSRKRGAPARPRGGRSPLDERDDLVAHRDVRDVVAHGDDHTGALRPDRPAGPGYMPSTLRTSRKLRPVARTATTASPAPGTGRSAASSTRPSSVPRSCTASR